MTGSLQQREGPNQVGLNKGSRPVDGTIYMALCGQVHHNIRAEIAELLCDRFSISDICLGKRVALITRDRSQGFKITSVCKTINYPNFVGSILDNMTNNGRTNKSRATSDKDLHILFTFNCQIYKYKTLH